MFQIFGNLDICHFELLSEKHLSSNIVSVKHFLTHSLLVKSVCQLVRYLSDPLSISFYLSVRICLFDPGVEIEAR